MSIPFLSIIVPAYNEAQRLPHTLVQIQRFLAVQSYPAEVLVVENGSQDGTLEIAQEFAKQWPNFFALHEPLRGKGRAVRRGMLAAKGEYRFMCDADLSMPIEEVGRFLPSVQGDFDLAIGSREAPGALRFNEPFYRHLGGRVINRIIQWLALPGLQDTQCGFKCFRAAVAEDLFRRLTLSGWSFDVEVLFLARRAGYRIVEVPITWYYNPQSKLNLVRDTLQMILDVLRVRSNAWRGVYDRPKPI